MIKINKKNNLTGKELENYLVDSESGSKRTVNLSGMQSRNKRTHNRINKRFNKLLLDFAFILFVFAVLFICLSFIVNNKKIILTTNATVFTIKKDIQQIKYNSIKEILSFSGCKTIQSEEDHIKEGHGSVYAMDVRCTKGQSDKVYAPLWKDSYLIVKKSYDKRLGDYLVLKHGEYTFVFGHTESGLNVGDRVNAGTHIGNTNKSGISENFHLHFELWKNNYNVSYKEMLGQNTLFNMEHTFDLRYQRNWYLETEEAMNFITDFEGFRSCSYVDGNGRLSIGYGTRAKFKGECISKELAKKRKIEFVEMTLKNVYQNHFLKYPNQRIALTSALYNLGINNSIAKVKYRKTNEGIKNYFLKFNKANGVVLNGLTKRRNLEGKKFVNEI